MNRALNKIKSGVCETTATPGENVVVDRVAQPPKNYKAHDGGLTKIATLQEITTSCGTIRWGRTSELVCRNLCPHRDSADETHKAIIQFHPPILQFHHKLLLNVFT